MKLQLLDLVLEQTNYMIGEVQRCWYKRFGTEIARLPHRVTLSFSARPSYDKEALSIMRTQVGDKTSLNIIE